MGYSRLLARYGRYAGLNRVLDLLPTKPLLLALNYHRIGDPQQTPYDPGVFSATAEGFHEQVRFLKRRFHLATPDEALEIIEGAKLRRTAILLTFDDGYRDNYETAFPILAAEGVQGAFFLPTSFVGTNHIAMWDMVAFIVKRSRLRRFRLPCAPLREFDLAADGEASVIGQVLSFYKSSGQGGEEFVAMLEEACDAPRPGGSERLFMDWSEAAAMLAGGMAIESHTHSHPPLSRVSGAALAGELAVSKRILEERLGHTVRFLAYPFGLPETISPAVFDAAREAGYRAAFSFFGGVNVPGTIERFNIRRQPVCPAEADTFQLRTTLMAAKAA
ncbi:MAG: polysaccharide deacetylase family protein [Acidobacteriia bacterium]|nr:polysaccharide deacetylase family protein [Terriglobia bacterium]